MKELVASELVLAPDGSVYHLRLKPENLADNVIVVGDPGRVPSISKYFDKVDFKAVNREIVVHTGEYNGTPITAMSTGMGTDNIDIVMNELDAVANIDLEKRAIKKEHRALNIIRLGTSGALHKSVEVDSIIASKYGIGLDGLASFYQLDDGVVDHTLSNQFIQQMQIAEELPKPYVVKGSTPLFDKVGADFIAGITATAPGFYGPQGRHLRIPLKYPAFNEGLQNVQLGGYNLLNFEMETSALYMLGKQLGHNMLTCCLVIANRVTGKFSSDYHTGVDRLIKTVLEKITA